jgi:CheY-like chemotaxis protein
VRTNIVAVIEDDPDIAALFADLLTDEGYDPILWNRGAGAYEFIKGHMPVAVLLDMNMETADAGLKVAEAVCADPVTRPIPIIVISARVDLLKREDPYLQELGCKVHPKPIDIPTLLALLSEVIRAEGATIGDGRQK